MADLQPSLVRDRFYSDEIEFENDEDIGLVIGEHGGVRLVQTFHKERQWDDDTPIAITVDERRLIVFLPCVYLP